jgi:hypothetical protein
MGRAYGLPSGILHEVLPFQLWNDILLEFNNCQGAITASHCLSVRVMYMPAMLADLTFLFSDRGLK